MGSERVVTVKQSVPALSYQWSVQVGEYDYQILCPGKSRVGTRTETKIRMEKVVRVRKEPTLKHKAEKNEKDESSGSFGEYSYKAMFKKSDAEKVAICVDNDPTYAAEKVALCVDDDPTDAAEKVAICVDDDPTDAAEKVAICVDDDPTVAAEKVEICVDDDPTVSAEKVEICVDDDPTVAAEKVQICVDDDPTVAAEKVQICVDDEKAGLTLKTDIEIREITDWVNERNVEVNMTCDEVVYKFVIWLIMDLTKSLDEEELRVVKMGRKPLTPPVAYHWAVQVGETWYEIASKNWETRDNDIHVSNGARALSGAGKLGGEVVGKSTKTDIKIKKWLKIWLCLHPRYYLLSDNCQKFAYELIVWVTNKNYLCDHRVDAANINTFDSEFRDTQSERVKGFVAAKNGNTILHLNLGGDNIASQGPINQRVKVGQFTAQAVAGPGLGAFVDVTLADVSLSAGNMAGFHFGLNANTGIGARNGNLEAHLLGFGGKVGADGIEVNSPVGGVNFCSLM